MNEEPKKLLEKNLVWFVIGVIVTAVVGTIAALSWLEGFVDQRINAKVATVEQVKEAIQNDPNIMSQISDSAKGADGASVDEIIAELQANHWTDLKAPPPAIEEIESAINKLQPSSAVITKIAETIGFTQINISNSSGCLRLSKIQMCYGKTGDLPVGSSYNHRVFEVEFAEKFAQIPIITLGILTNNPRHGGFFGVYRFDELDEFRFKGALYERDGRDEVGTVQVQLNYLAIGKY